MTNEKTTSQEVITQDELQTLQDLQRRGQNITSELGQIEFSKIMLEERRKNAETFLNNLRKDEEKFMSELNINYGPIVVNPETGEITKNQ